MEKNNISTYKCFMGIILSIIILIISQIVALSLSGILLKIKVSSIICNLTAATLYVLITTIGVSILIKKFLKMSFEDIRFSFKNINLKYIIIAILMPVIVIVAYQIIGVDFVDNKFALSEKIRHVISSIIYYGMAVGIVEEMIFRGVMLTCLEKRYNIKIAIIVPSVIFGFLHIIGNNLNFISLIQLIIAGSIVGILFSIVTYESNSFFNSAIIHGFWNTMIIGGIFNINTNIDKDALYNFIIKSKSFILTGGDFGIEASIISIIVYLIFTIFVLSFLKKNKEERI